MKPKIYIACGLTHVPRKVFDKYVKSIHNLAANLNAYEVKYALVNSDPQLSRLPHQDKAKYCYLWDRKLVEDSDLIIAEASFPSIGLGIELQIAEAKNIPIILIYQDFTENKAEPIGYSNPDKHNYELQIGDGYVSLMALGLPNILQIINYGDIHTCTTQIDNEIKKLTQS